MKNFIYLLIVLGVAVKFGFLSNPFTSSKQQSGTVVLTEPVIMYSTAWCGYCTKARKLMDKKGIDYVEYDIEKSYKAKREYDKLNAKGTPTFIINGQTIYGFDKGLLSSLKNKT